MLAPYYIPTAEHGMKCMKISDQLIAAQNLIRDPKHWCRRRLAEPMYIWNFLPFVTESDDPNGFWATRWCAYGALQKIAGKLNASSIVYYLNNASKKLYNKPYITGLNDDIFSDHSDVMKVYDEAIRMAIVDEVNN